MQHSHIKLQQLMNHFLGIKHFTLKTCFYFQYLTKAAEFYTSIGIHTCTHMKILHWTALLLLSPQQFIYAGTFEKRSVTLTSVHHIHIEFHKHQAIKICNSDFKNWIMGQMEIQNWLLPDVKKDHFSSETLNYNKLQNYVHLCQ